MAPDYLASQWRRDRLAMLIDECIRKHNFDPGQEKSISMLDKRSLILVQGPPGTGKSFTGVKMAQVLAQFRGEVLDEQLRSSYTMLAALDDQVEVPGVGVQRAHGGRIEGVQPQHAVLENERNVKGRWDKPKRAIAGLRLFWVARGGKEGIGMEWFALADQEGQCNGFQGT